MYTIEQLREVIKAELDKQEYVEEPYSDKSLDFGIAQLHFQLGAQEKGVKGEWDLNGRFCTENSKVIKFPESEYQLNDNAQENNENE